MNNFLPASCGLVSARTLPAECRTALAGAVSVLPEKFLYFSLPDGGAWLGRTGSQLLYLQFSADMPMQLHCLPLQDILCLCCTKKLLEENCCIYYRLYGSVRHLTLPLSQMRRELIIQLLFALLRPPEDVTSMLSSAPPTGTDELQELYSYAPAAAALGQQTSRWNLWRIEEKGFPFRKKGHGSAALYWELEHGSVVVARRNTQVVTWYLPSGRSSLLSCPEHGTLTLRIRTEQQILGEIPHLKTESMISA